MEASRENSELKPTSGNYQHSRLNATRHGILSRDTVLPWESQPEYEELLGALNQEHEPQGPTEEDLVGELADIIWRKRRLRRSENAACRDKYRQLLTMDSGRFVEAGILDEVRLMQKQQKQSLAWLKKMGFMGSSEGGDDYGPYVRDIFDMNAEEAARTLKEVEEDILNCWKVLDILKPQNEEAYQRAEETLNPDIQKLWVQDLADELYQPTPRGLRDFLFSVLADENKHRAVLANHGAIRAQVQGEACHPERLEKFCRYEVFLDRKMEKTLAMLFKLQELRRARHPARG
jgi:hypothetical protein